MNVLFFDLLSKDLGKYSLVDSWCRRNKRELVCDLKSLSRNVILQTLFPAPFIVLIAGNKFL